ncbi:MAG: SDR family oxidoreductase [Methanoregula sp.]|uniref:SDR family oxidoreductase n=1 Tax=Methanoregula sp. TaxID=2052170 RepID=UPI003C3AB639
MKYIVTGGAGFIGSHIVEGLAGQKHEVVILDNLFSGKMENISPFLEKDNVSFANGSITDLPLLRKTFEGADGIFHEGAIASVPYSVTHPAESHEVNLTGTLNVLAAARDCGVKNVVFASSAAVYGDRPELPKREDMIPETLSPYAVTKLAGEYYCSVFSRLYGVRCVALRYFNVFGPRQDPSSPYSGVISKFIANTLNRCPLVIFGDGCQTRDFVYVKDVVQANIRAMESGEQGVFNIACGKQINLRELAEMIMEISGITVPVTFGSPAEGDVRDSVADISRAQDAFGYAPRYTVKTGLQETISWYR